MNHIFILISFMNSQISHIFNHLITNDIKSFWILNVVILVVCFICCRWNKIVHTLTRFIPISNDGTDWTQNVLYGIA